MGEVAAFAAGAEAVDVLAGDLATMLVVATDHGLYEVDPDQVERTWTPTMDQTIRLATVRADLGSATRIGDVVAALARAEQVGAAAVRPWPRDWQHAPST